MSILDSPRRLNLTERSTKIRASLKDWEKSFATTHDGRKPSQRDIKAEPVIAKTYKEYNQLRDVLAGKVEYTVLEASSPAKKQRRDIGSHGTPTKPKNLHPSQLDPYLPPMSASPKHVFLGAIGPTPQRDGKALGLFDLLSTSGGSTHTPSHPKHKLDRILPEADEYASSPAVTQTPHRKRKAEGDLLEHLDAPETGRKELFRSPASTGKRFLLNQFFATPRTMRYTAMVEQDENSAEVVDKTPLRTMVLQKPLDRLEDKENDVDATPPFLKRSKSFKERLISGTMVPPSQAPILRRYKSAPKPLSQIVQDLRKLADEAYDDDLEALREIEGNVLVGSSQPATHETAEYEEDIPLGGLTDDQLKTPEPEPQPKVWKKKGQKRTTRRSVMRPTNVTRREESKFIAPEGVIDDEALRVEETQLQPDHNEDAPYESSEDELNVLEEPTARTKSKDRKDQKADKSRKTEAGKINPNAHSHLNFRSLKIRNKNSKAKGAGRSRFRGRRK